MWYSVNLLFKSEQVGTDSEPSIWEESILLIDATNETDARCKAEHLGRSKAHSYHADAALIVWTFERIERVFCIEDQELRNGTELFSRFLRDAEVKSLLVPFDDTNVN